MSSRCATRMSTPSTALAGNGGASEMGRSTVALIDDVLDVVPGLGPGELDGALAVVRRHVPAPGEELRSGVLGVLEVGGEAAAREGDRLGEGGVALNDRQQAHGHALDDGQPITLVA